MQPLAVPQTESRAPVLYQTATSWPESAKPIIATTQDWHTGVRKAARLAADTGRRCEPSGKTIYRGQVRVEDADLRRLGDVAHLQHVTELLFGVVQQSADTNVQQPPGVRAQQKRQVEKEVHSSIALQSQEHLVSKPNRSAMAAFQEKRGLGLNRQYKLKGLGGQVQWNQTSTRLRWGRSGRHTSADAGARRSE